MFHPGEDYSTLEGGAGGLPPYLGARGLLAWSAPFLRSYGQRVRRAVPVLHADFQGLVSIAITIDKAHDLLAVLSAAYRSPVVDCSEMYVLPDGPTPVT